MPYQFQVIKLAYVTNNGGQVTTTLTTNIFNNLRFQPDELIVKAFSYGGDNNGRAYQLWSNLVDDGFLLVFSSQQMSQNYDIHFDLRDKKISGGTYTFQIQELGVGTTIGSVPADGAVAQWNLLLELRKYQK